MALKWFRKNKDKKDSEEKVDPEKDAQQAESEEIGDPDFLKPEDQEISALEDAVDESENVIEDEIEESTAPPDNDDPGKPEKAGYFKRLKNRLFKSRKSFSGGFDRIFTGKTKIDDEILEELEEHLITSDIGVQTTIELIERISKAKVKDVNQVKSLLKDEILSIISSHPDAPQVHENTPHVVLVVGVNGFPDTVDPHHQHYMWRVVIFFRSSGMRA